MDENIIALNNSKAFNSSFLKLALCNLQGEARPIAAEMVGLGDTKIPILFATNDSITSPSFINVEQKMIFQRVVGILLKHGVEFTPDGVFIPQKITVHELFDEIVKRDTKGNEITYTNKIIENLKMLDKVSLHIDEKRECIDANGNPIFKEIEKYEHLLPLKYSREKVKYHNGEYESLVITVYDFPNIWAVNAQSKNEILLVDKELFNFKNIEDKSGDLSRIPAKESLRYQALKECIVLAVQNRKYWLQQQHMIKKNGYKLVYPKNTTKEKWERFRKISFMTILQEMMVIDKKGNLIGEYAQKDDNEEQLGQDLLYRRINIEKKIKSEITGILAALKYKGFIDDYYEYKKDSVFAGWIVDPSTKYDDIVTAN